MGNICKKPKDDDVKPANLPNHKRNGPTMVSYDFDSARGQMRSLEALSAAPQPEAQEEGKRPVAVKKLGLRR